MRVIARKALREFWEKHSDAEQPLRAWYAEVKKAKWRNPNELKQHYGRASILGNNRVVFNISGNRYRLVVAIKYEFLIVYVRFIGTHSAYDKIKAEEA